MKKAYIIPEIQIYDADAEEILTGSVNNNPEMDSSDTGISGSIGSQEEESGEGSLAKPGNFFCDNFEYDFDF